MHLTCLTFLLVFATGKCTLLNNADIEEIANIYFKMGLRILDVMKSQTVEEISYTPNSYTVHYSYHRNEAPNPSMQNFAPPNHVAFTPESNEASNNRPLDAGEVIETSNDRPRYVGTNTRMPSNWNFDFGTNSHNAGSGFKTKTPIVTDRNDVPSSTTIYHTLNNPESSTISKTHQDEQPKARPTTVPYPTNSFNEFSRQLYQYVAGPHIQTNVVYSPISLQTLLTLLYTGATGNTAKQLQAALVLPPEKDIAAQQFKALLSSMPSISSSSELPKLIMANKIYVAEHLQLGNDVMTLAQHNFDAELEHTRFETPQSAARAINAWVAQKTHNRIEQLISSAAIETSTQAILVNAIYFKALWEQQFSKRDTSKANFRVHAEQTESVDMMFNDDSFNYGEIEKLNAKVLELPYKNSNLSMLLILPDEVNGLVDLEMRLTNYDLKQIDASMTMESVEIRIPKFKIEFELDMIEPLRKLGITALFDDSAELPLFFPQERVSVSKVQHKAFLEVNEAGSEAAAATFVKLQPLSLPAKQLYFTADHPFVFAIRSPDVVYFMGHVVNPNMSS